MDQYLDVLKLCDLFSSIDEGDLKQVLSCLGYKILHPKKDEILLLVGDRPTHVGVVLTGALHVTKDDYDGNRTIVAAVTPGEMFAETLCSAGVSESPVTVVADNDSAVMLVRFDKIISTCEKACSFHAKLVENMLGIIAGKNLLLQSRLDIISARSIRTRVLRYLSLIAPKKGQTVTIPFDREEMADYLCVERTALSHELSKMKAEGLIDYNKNRFQLK